MHQTQEVLEDARGLLMDQARVQRDHLVDLLGTMGSDLDRMRIQAPSGLAADLVSQTAHHLRSLRTQLDGREPSDVLDDVRRFARRRPGTFLLGALAAGLVAGRLARGMKEAQSSMSPSSPRVPSQTLSSTGGSHGEYGAQGSITPLGTTTTGTVPTMTSATDPITSATTQSGSIAEGFQDGPGELR